MERVRWVKPRLQFNLQAISAVTKTDPIRPKVPVSYSRWPAPEPWSGKRGSPAGVPLLRKGLPSATASRRRPELASEGGELVSRLCGWDVWTSPNPGSSSTYGTCQTALREVVVQLRFGFPDALHDLIKCQMGRHREPHHTLSSLDWRITRAHQATRSRDDVTYSI